MGSKKKLLSGCKLYLILDAGVVPHDRLFAVMKEAAFSGVDIVQLRDKLSVIKETLQFSKRAVSWLKGKIPFIVNDRVDVARLAGASGVHLGQDDIPVLEARRILGPRAVIGVSCQSLGHLRRACREGADYIGYGSVFRTLTKPDRCPMDQGLLAKAARYAETRGMPLFAIGGITKDNAGGLAAKGVRRIAVCRDILLANDVRRSVGELRAALGVGP